MKGVKMPLYWPSWSWDIKSWLPSKKYSGGKATSVEIKPEVCGQVDGLSLKRV